MASCKECIHRYVCGIHQPEFKDILSDGGKCSEYKPTANVAEVKHGEWHLLDECSNEGVYCSVCHKKVYRKQYANQKVKSKYCPNCGAKMDGGRNNNG